MKKYKNKITTSIIIAVILVLVYWWGGNSPGLRGWNPEAEEQKITETVSEKINTSEPEISESAKEEQKEEPIVPEVKEEIVKEPEPETEAINEPVASPVLVPQSAYESVEEDNSAYYQNRGMEIDEKTGMDIYNTTAVPEGKPIPIEPQNAVISDKELSCTLSVRCDTVFNNMSWLNPEKAELLPQNGEIFAEQMVTFYEGESVFNLLVREMKKNKIHLEFENTPIYNSAYIEGINNLYEFDCGELSGWMYRVNGWFPNYGCSRYQLKEGDRVEWIFTCSLGKDIGGFNAASGK